MSFHADHVPEPGGMNAVVDDVMTQNYHVPMKLERLQLLCILIYIELICSCILRILSAKREKPRQVTHTK